MPGKEVFEQAKKRALRYLSYAPRSESQVKIKLRGLFPEGVVDEAVSWLKERGYLNDRDFAQSWKANRLAFRPRGRLAMKQELLRKGIDSSLVDEVLADVDEEKAAYEAARKKASALKDTDYSTFRQRLGAFLRRRGFDYDVIRLVVEALWRESTSFSG